MEATSLTVGGDDKAVESDESQRSSTTTQNLHFRPKTATAKGNGGGEATRLINATFSLTAASWRLPS